MVLCGVQVYRAALHTRPYGPPNNLNYDPHVGTPRTSVL
jgi:hypothetical protein